MSTRGTGCRNRVTRGWADLVATRLAVEIGPAFQYANLAIRGRLFDQVLAEQLEPTLDMRPDLVSFAAGGNDIRGRAPPGRRSRAELARRRGRRIPALNHQGRSSSQPTSVKAGFDEQMSLLGPPSRWPAPE
ncbi:GDSL-type esterase/lipase family protein [Actinoplanes sp. DH11]|uniref:GDSL-type esterase/lipase family protein n=1 Tax=Actinoplanes sp. DH11 TaxID=2857011 RepID=UPI0035AF5369